MIPRGAPSFKLVLFMMTLTSIVRSTLHEASQQMYWFRDGNGFTHLILVEAQDGHRRGLLDDDDVRRRISCTAGCDTQRGDNDEESEKRGTSERTKSHGDRSCPRASDGLESVRRYRERELLGAPANAGEIRPSFG